MIVAKTRRLARSFGDDVLEDYRHPWWLRSAHGADRLDAQFGESRAIEIPLDIVLAGGTSMNSNRTFVSEVYDYLCFQSYVKPPGRPREAVAEWKHFVMALHVLDYLILNDDGEALGSTGLSCVTSQTLTQLLLDVAGHRTGAESFYGWRKRLKDFITRSAAKLSNDEVLVALKAAPALRDISVAKEDWTFSTQRRDILRARAFLHLGGFYRNRDSRSSPFHRTPSVSSLARIIFKDTLYGWRSEFPSMSATYPELCLGPVTAHQRERPAVSVWAGRNDGRCSENRFGQYKAKLAGFLTLAEMNVGIEVEALKAALEIDYERLEGVSLKSLDGVNPAPPAAVAFALRESIEFFYSHGDHLLTSAARVLRTAGEHGLEPLQLSGVEALLEPATRAFGIRVWSLEEHLKETQGRRASSETYLQALRGARLGLLDLITCLYGAVLLVVGTTQAGRNGEVEDITEEDIAQPGWLQLLTRKAGSPRARHQDFRPIPQVSEDMLRRLAQFHSDCGVSVERLFCLPRLKGRFGPVSFNELARAKDSFLDYVGGHCDPAGRRFYLRQHQLRGFFAEAFFYCLGFAGLDTLRWFLRHVDPEQLWAYIEHTTPGAVLRRHKAAAAVHEIRGGKQDFGQLMDLIRSRFGVNKLEVLTDSELTELIEDLQHQGSVRIHPVFVRRHGRATFDTIRLGVLVKV